MTDKPTTPAKPRAKAKAKPKARRAAASPPPANAEKRAPRMEDVKPILEIVSDGQSLRAACRQLKIHSGDMHALLTSTPELDAQYARSREARADVFQEQAINLGLAAATGRSIDIGDGTKHTIKPDGARVALDAIKWATARMAPKTAPAAKLDVRVGELPDLSRMSDEDLAELNRLLEKTTGEAPSDGEAEPPTESE